MLSYQIKVLKLVMVITLEWSFKLEGTLKTRQIMWKWRIITVFLPMVSMQNV